jgi:lysophospholipase L1-like esterase
MTHIVLLGDSIFDNKAYVGDGPELASQLRALLRDGRRATLRAVDGSVVANVEGQFRERPPDATHLVVSAGGNDAIMNADILSLPVSSAAAVFDALADRTGNFAFQYRAMLETILSANLPTAVCTVYYPNFSDPVFQKLATAALSAFNDVITREAIAAGVPLIDLRLVCDEPDDYANEIEPSVKGGRKIAAKILEVVENHDFSKQRTTVYF